MTKEQILALKTDRLSKIVNKGTNVKCPGVVRKLRREIRNLTK